MWNSDGQLPCSVHPTSILLCRWRFWFLTGGSRTVCVARLPMGVVVSHTPFVKIHNKKISIL
uniref:Uncharacterized protein n=1 Tax=Anguilla anguilla TaxID=7936 RepID=A0A0E9WLD4_ANGAN